MRAGAPDHRHLAAGRRRAVKTWASTEPPSRPRPAPRSMIHSSLSPWSSCNCGVSARRASAAAGERGDDQRHRRHRALFDSPWLPDDLHRHRILADRNRDTERGTQLHADRVHRVVQARRPHLDDRRPPSSSPTCAPRRGAPAQRRDWSAPRRPPCAPMPPHRAGPAACARPSPSPRRHGRRNRPGSRRNRQPAPARPDHRIARTQAADAAVADRDQEGLAADRREAQHALDRLVEFDAFGIGDDRERSRRCAANRAACAAVCRTARRAADRSGDDGNRESGIGNR